MGRSDYFKDGDWNGICDQCGRKYKATKLKQTWDGMRECNQCWEVRHPQDFVRGVQDDQTPPFVKPEAPDTFV
jgi:hypothetical protein